MPKQSPMISVDNACGSGTSKTLYASGFSTQDSKV